MTEILQKFVREGFLNRWNNNTLIPQLFILFSDALLFASLQQDDCNFVLNGIVSMRGLKVNHCYCEMFIGLS